MPAARLGKPPIVWPHLLADHPTVFTFQGAFGPGGRPTGRCPATTFSVEAGRIVVPPPGQSRLRESIRVELSPPLPPAPLSIGGARGSNPVNIYRDCSCASRTGLSPVAHAATTAQSWTVGSRRLCAFDRPRWNSHSGHQLLIGIPPGWCSTACREVDWPAPDNSDVGIFPDLDRPSSNRFPRGR